MNEMDFSFVEIKTILLIVHLVGLALGVGGAIISDVMFFRAIRDWRISKTEMAFLTLTSWAIGIGLGLLILSGLGMFSLDPEKYLASSKFLAKMTVVVILAVNAALLHFWHIPHFRHVAKKNLSTRTSFSKRRLAILVSGVISIVSWLSALVLGAFRSIPWSYETILSIYVFVLMCGFIVVFFLRNHLMPIRPTEQETT
jgi:hypothetical protein